MCSSHDEKKICTNSQNLEEKAFTDIKWGRSPVTSIMIPLSP